MTTIHTTQPAQRSQTEDFLHAFNGMPLARQLIPMESNIGWPLPRRQGQTPQLFVIWPFYQVNLNAQAKTRELFPLSATVTIAWKTRTVVEYADLRYHGVAPWGPPKPVGTFPHEALAGLTVGQYEEKKSALLFLFDRLFDSLSGGAPLDAQFLEQFGTLFRQMMEPPLVPFYRALAPKFIDQFIGPAK